MKHNIHDGNMTANMMEHSIRDGDMDAKVTEHNICDGDMNDNTMEHNIRNGDMNAKVMEHNIRDGDIRWQISKSVNDNTFFFARFHKPFIISEMLAFQIFDLEKIGQGHDAQRSKSRDSKGNIVGRIMAGTLFGDIYNCFVWFPIGFRKAN